ncbi:B-box type zinc finger protein with CCT domain-containing protein [Actinidia rufa]|uniref:B-box type zinc finger protein with CCT domain-containing protein n=1 Tax=Actinidia rufa TaxID=165716 RepID=A0A7J0FKB2_9ERIC|nr:B-box type zinc finger protein with CCT domain-containing protein [Actinidia rufa]
MEPPLCEFCWVLGAVVYCKSDSARLCLSCDSFVHSANQLSRRHTRSLLCNNCGSQPAIVHCLFKKMSLCESCDWNGNACSGLGHSHQALVFYSGCPSRAEFWRIWSSVIDGNCLGICSEPTGNEESAGLALSKLNELQPCGKLEPWDYRSDLKSFMLGLTRYRMLCEVISRFHFEDGGTDCQLKEKNVSVPESNGHAKNALEASSSAQKKCLASQSSHVGGSDDFMQAASGIANCMLLNPISNRNINLGFPNGHTSNLSLSPSNITGESSAADSKDCSLAPVFLMGESPWESNLEFSCPQAREKAKMRYNEKKKTRMFGKHIRYESRKARADTRKRVKASIISRPDSKKVQSFPSANIMLIYIEVVRHGEKFLSLKHYWVVIGDNDETVLIL